MPGIFLTSGKPEAANSDCEAPQKTRKDGRGFPDVVRPELKVRERPIFIPTLHVRKTEKCHRGACRAGWQFPDVTRPELKVHGMPIFIPTLHVRKTDNGKTGREVPNRPLECATRDWESGKQNRKSTNKGARGLCANCWRVLS